MLVKFNVPCTLQQENPSQRAWLTSQLAAMVGIEDVRLKITSRKHLDCWSGWIEREGKRIFFCLDRKNAYRAGRPPSHAFQIQMRHQVDDISFFFTSTSHAFIVLPNAKEKRSERVWIIKRVKRLYFYLPNRRLGEVSSQLLNIYLIWHFSNELCILAYATVVFTI